MIIECLTPEEMRLIIDRRIDRANKLTNDGYITAKEREDIIFSIVDYLFNLAQKAETARAAQRMI